MNDLVERSRSVLNLGEWNEGVDGKYLSCHGMDKKELAKVYKHIIFVHFSIDCWSKDGRK